MNWGLTSHLSVTLVLVRMCSVYVAACLPSGTYVRPIYVGLLDRFDFHGDTAPPRHVAMRRAKLGSRPTEARGPALVWTLNKLLLASFSPGPARVRAMGSACFGPFCSFVGRRRFLLACRLHHRTYTLSLVVNNSNTAPDIVLGLHALLSSSLCWLVVLPLPPARPPPVNSEIEVAWLIRQTEKHCLLICCERKTVFLR